MPSRKRRTQAERSSATQAAVLEAALAVMLERGYLGLRIAEVARRAGVSRGALMHHFPTRNELATRAIERGYVRVMEQTLARVNALDPLADPIQALIADSREFFFNRFFFLLVDMILSGPKEASSTSGAFTRRFRLEIEEAWIKALQARGMPVERATDAVWLTMSIVRGLALRTLFQDEPVRFQHLFDVWRTLFWNAESAADPVPRLERTS